MSQQQKSSFSQPTSSGATTRTKPAKSSHSRHTGADFSSTYALSSTEYSTLLQSKQKQKQIDRLLKVREATKAARLKQKQKYLSTKSKAEASRNELLRQQWEQEKEMKIRQLRQQLLSRKKMSGTAMKMAQQQQKENQEWASEAFWQYHEDETIKEARGNQALKHEKNAKRDITEEVKRKRRKMVKEVEEERKEWLLEEKPYGGNLIPPQDEMNHSDPTQPGAPTKLDAKYHNNLDYLQSKTQQLLSTLHPRIQQQERWNQQERQEDYSKTRFHDRPVPKDVTNCAPGTIPRVQKHTIGTAADSSSAALLPPDARTQAVYVAQQTEARLKQSKHQKEHSRIAAIKRAREAYQKIKTQEFKENVSQHLDAMQEANTKRRMREIGAYNLRTHADDKLQAAKQRSMERDFESLMLG